MVTPTAVKPLRSAPHSRWVSATGLAWGIILASLIPLLLLHFRRLWLYEHYHYFPFVVAAFVYFVWQRWPTADPSERGSMPKTEFLCLLLGLLLLAAATVIWTSWLAAVAAIFTIG